MSDKQEKHVVLKPCRLCGKRITLDEYVADTYVADAYGVYHRKCKDSAVEDPKVMASTPEDQILAMEDDQIVTAAAYFVAYNSVVGKGRDLTTQEIVDELKKYDNYDDTRLYRLVKEYAQVIDDMVGVIFDATIPE
jgi:hypothetical protein